MGGGGGSSISRSMNVLFGIVMVIKYMIANGWINGVGNGLSMNYYIMACPIADLIVRNAVNTALQSDPTLAAGLVRMHFHDCFVEVCGYYNIYIYICYFLFH